MSLIIQITGEVSEKRQGVSEKTRNAWFATEIAYMGGSQNVYLDSEDEFNAIPAEGTPVVLQAKGKIGFDGKLRLSNVQVESAEPKRRAAASA